MNQITLIGRSGAKAELRYTPNKLAVCTFSLATNDGTKEKKITSWHKITLFGKTAELFADRIDRGTEVFVQGKLQYNEWTKKDGTKVTTPSIIGSWIRVVEQPYQVKDQSSSQPGSLEEPSSFSQPSFTEEDIPF